MVWRGKVILQITINIDGSVKDVEIYESSGYDILDEAAKDCARQWHFEPARKSDGKAVMARVRTKLEFRIEKSAVAKEES